MVDKKNKVSFETFLPDEEAMLAFGKTLFQAASAHAIIFLDGELGAGKTTLARGFLRAAGFKGKVKSPTYTLIESYETAKHKVFHFDLYRLREAKELTYIGIEEYFLPDSICLIEWPEKGFPLLPDPDLICFLSFVDEGRSIRIEYGTPHGLQMIHKLLQ